jgi:hypothetical protein
MVLKSLKIILLICGLLVFNENIFAQKMIVKKFEGFMIPETGALFNANKGKVSCDFVPSSENRPKGYQDLDIKAGDLILYVNGKKIKTIKDLKDNYESFKAGDEIKLGIKCGEDLLITSFKKADPKDLPETMQITSGSSGNMMQMKSEKIVKKNGKIYLGGKEVKIDSLQKSGNQKIMIINKQEEKKK